MNHLLNDTKPMAYLTNWAGDTYSQTFTLRGYVFCHSKIPDGMSVHTTPVQSWNREEGWAITKNTHYILGLNYYDLNELLIKHKRSLCAD